MPSNPPTVADLAAEVSERCGLMLAEAGQYLPGGLTPSILEGLRRGCKAVGLTPADLLTLADLDAAALSTSAVERVEDEAELFALRRALLFWWKVAREDQDAVSAQPVASGWRLEQKRSLQARVAELTAACSAPYREPSDPIAVPGRPGPGATGWSGHHGPCFEPWSGEYS